MFMMAVKSELFLKEEEREEEEEEEEATWTKGKDVSSGKKRAAWPGPPNPHTPQMSRCSSRVHVGGEPGLLRG